MRKTLKERLVAGEKIAVTKEELDEISTLVPNLSLHSKLAEMEKNGHIATRSSDNEGGRRWTYQDRDLEIHHRVYGETKWKNGPSYGFTRPHDLAVDVETEQIIAYAVTL